MNSRGAVPLRAACGRLRLDRWRRARLHLGRARGGTVFDGSARVRSELAATFYNALHVAADLGAARVAVPALCAGGCRFPADEVAAIAVHAAASTEAPLRLVRFVLSDRLVYTAFLRALSARVDNG